MSREITVEPLTAAAAHPSGSVGPVSPEPLGSSTSVNSARRQAWPPQPVSGARTRHRAGRHDTAVSRAGS